MKHKEVLAISIIAFIGKLLFGCLGCLLHGLQCVWNKAVEWAMAYLRKQTQLPKRESQGVAKRCSAPDIDRQIKRLKRKHDIK